MLVGLELTVAVDLITTEDMIIETTTTEGAMATEEVTVVEAPITKDMLGMMGTTETRIAEMTGVMIAREAVAEVITAIMPEMIHIMTDMKANPGMTTMTGHRKVSSFSFSVKKKFRKEDIQFLFLFLILPMTRRLHACRIIGVLHNT